MTELFLVIAAACHHADLQALASADFPTRQAATARLARVTALRALDAGERSPDPEVRWRCKEARRRLLARWPRLVAARRKWLQARAALAAVYGPGREYGDEELFELAPGLVLVAGATLPYYSPWEDAPAYHYRYVLGLLRERRWRPFRAGGGYGY